MKQTIAVNDANILIDFCDVGLADQLTRLDLLMLTTDIVVSELQTPEHRTQIMRLVAEGHLRVSTFSGEEIGKIALKQIQVRVLSLADCSVWFLAGQRKAILLTGDRLLRREAEKEGIEVHGSLWILDKMVEAKVLAEATACQALLQLMAKNPRLPRGECEERRERWCEKKQATSLIFKR